MQEIIGAGPRIRKWRKGIGMKAYMLAEKLKISQGSLSDIENGKSNPSAPTIVSFIKYTDINIRWMLTGQTGKIERGEIAKEQVLTINLNPKFKQFLIKVTD